MSAHATQHASPNAHAQTQPSATADVTEARHAAERLKALGRQISSASEALQSARETVDPKTMRAAVDKAQLVLNVLSENSKIIRKGIEQHPHDERHLSDIVQAIETQADPLREQVARTGRQADELEGAVSGPLSSLPQGPEATSAAEIQRQADENAFPGICDDSAMQGTAACPLQAASRDANRDFVTLQLTGIADDWRQAVSMAFTEKKIEPLLEKDQGAVLGELLFGLALSAVGGMAASYAFKGLTRLAGPGPSAVPQVSKFDISDIPTPTAINNPGPDMFKSLGKKLGNTAGKKLAKSAYKAGDPPQDHAHDTAFFEILSDVVKDWRTQVVGSVRQLPDAALVSLGAGLKTPIFTTAYFKQKVDQLVGRFSQLDKGLGRVIELGGRRLEMLLVVHPSGATRFALARKEVRWENHTQHDHTVGSGDPVDVETGRWTFVNWVDSSLLDMAHTIGKERQAENGVVMNTADLRWANLANPDLVAWHVNPSKLDDVVMFDQRTSP